MFRARPTVIVFVEMALLCSLLLLIGAVAGLAASAVIFALTLRLTADYETSMTIAMMIFFIIGTFTVFRLLDPAERLSARIFRRR